MYGQNYIPYSYMGASYGMPNYGQRQFVQPQQQMAQQQQAQQPIQQSQQQMQQPPMQSPTSFPQPTMPFIYETPIQAVRFATEEEAKAYIVYPNATTVFIDEGKGKIYLKTANSAGVSSIRCYNENKGEEEKKAPQEVQQSVDYGRFVKKEQLSGFVTMDQYKQLVDDYKFLENQMRIMQNQIKGTKSPSASVSSVTEQKSAVPCCGSK